MIRQLFEPHIQKASHDSVFGGRATILLTHKISHDLLPLVGLSGFPAGWNPGKKRLCAAFFRLPAVPRSKRVYSCRGLHVDHHVNHRDILLSIAPTRRSLFCCSGAPVMSTTSRTAQASAAEPWAIR